MIDTPQAESARAFNRLLHLMTTYDSSLFVNIHPADARTMKLRRVEINLTVKDDAGLGEIIFDKSTTTESDQPWAIRDAAVGLLTQAFTDLRLHGTEDSP